MHSIQSAKPKEALLPFVRQYAQREAYIPQVITVEPVPARSEPILEFQFSDPYEIRHSAGEQMEIAPRSVVVGTQTWGRVQLLLRGQIDTFVVIFQPLGFFRFLGFNGKELVNRAAEAGTVIGNEIVEVWEKLAECGSFANRITVIEEFLCRRLRVTEPTDVISYTASRILQAEGQVRIRDLAYQSGLSIRQMERKFLSQVGVSPKTYARIARFGGALRMKAKVPTESWANVAAQLGYHDQMHMVHDFQELSGDSPSKSLAGVEMVYRAQLAP
jgi:AraC-like DNA-binding protein